MSATPHELAWTLDDVPQRPGVYLFHDAADEVLYVGKARDLRARLASYRRPGADGRINVAFLERDAKRVETIVTRTEGEALLLEDTLIKQYKPPHNIRLKDDKSFLMVRLDHAERFPRLKFISAENGLDWLPWYISRVKRARGGVTSFGAKLTMEPIEYFYRNFFFTYIDNPEAVEHRQIIGVDNLMFATDYPHSASTWPKSQEVVERDIATWAVPEEEKRKLIHDNVLKVFNIASPVPA